MRVDDLPGAVALEQDESSVPWVPALPEGDAVAVVAFFDECRQAGELLHLVIADRVTDQYLGEVTLALGEHRVGELGCGLLQTARGRGLATDSLRLLAAWSFAALDLARTQVFVAQTNEPAQRLVARAGFQREGVLRAYWEHDGARLDTAIFSLLPADLVVAQ